MSFIFHSSGAPSAARFCGGGCLLGWLLFALGCASPVRPPAPMPAHAFPAEALITQRGVLTVFGGRQFTLNGYLAVSATQGARLVLTENFGAVLADVFVAPDGGARVMKSSPAFRPEWIERYIATDLRCVLGQAAPAACSAEWLSPDRLRLQRRWYRLELQTVAIQPGPAPAKMFELQAADTP